VSRVGQVRVWQAQATVVPVDNDRTYGMYTAFRRLKLQVGPTQLVRQAPQSHGHVVVPGHCCALLPRGVQAPAALPPSTEMCVPHGGGCSREALLPRFPPLEHSFAGPTILPGTHTCARTHTHTHARTHTHSQAHTHKRRWVDVPLGSIRVSLGHMSTFEDSYALVDFVRTKYTDRQA